MSITKESSMASVTVSPKYQLVIPREVRDQAGVKAGMKLTVIAKGGIIYLIPEHRIEELFGMLEGIGPGGVREEEDRI
jgi:AbrB family looped-hinge helix DNA binding protein